MRLGAGRLTLLPLCALLCATLPLAASRRTPGMMRRCQICGAAHRNDSAACRLPPEPAAAAGDAQAPSRPAAGRSRALLQPDGSDIWATFSSDTNTYVKGPVLVASTPAVTAEACASACGADQGCVIWTHCPAEAADG